MNIEDIEDLAVKFATEGLNPEEQAIYDAWILNAEDNEKSAFTSMIDLYADFSEATAVQQYGDLEISPQVKTYILSKIEQAEKRNGTKLVRSREQEWIHLPIKGAGARLLELSARKSDGFAVSIIEVKPGGVFPGHTHHGVEMAYILEGDLEADGILLNAGDFCRADAGTHHGEHISPSGCRALMITSNDNYQHKTVKTLATAQKVIRKIKDIFTTSKK